MDPVLRDIGPQDVDANSDLIGKQGIAAGGTARELLRRHAKAMPNEIKVLMLQPKDQARTDALDFEELAEHAEAPIVSASVRGNSVDKLVVVYAIETEAGRHPKGTVPYSELEDSQERYEDAKSRVAPTSVSQVIENDNADLLDEVRALREEVGQLQADREVEQEQGQGSQTGKVVERGAQARGKGVGTTAPEEEESAGDAEPEEEETEDDEHNVLPPTDDYDSLNADQAKDRLNSAQDNGELELAKDIVRYERVEKNRKTVLDAAGDAVVSELETEANAAAASGNDAD